MSDAELGLVLDRSRLASALGDDEALIREILGLYIETTSRHLPKLRAAVAASDVQGVLGLAHAIKGSSGSVGADRAMRCAQGLEEAALAGDMAAAMARLAELEGALTAVKAVIG